MPLSRQTVRLPGGRAGRRRRVHRRLRSQFRHHRDGQDHEPRRHRLSLRQVQRYLKQLSDLNLIVREGGRKNGIWKILDEEYEGFFKRI